MRELIFVVGVLIVLAHVTVVVANRCEPCNSTHHKPIFSGRFMHFSVMATLLAFVLPALGYGQSFPSDQVPLEYVRTANPLMHSSAYADGGSGVLGRRSSGGVLGVDSIPNWSSYFYKPAADGSQYTWQYTMVGNSPFDKSRDSDDSRDPDSPGGKTTTIDGPVIPVNMDLRNYNGSPRYVNGVRLYLDATHLVAPVLSSPVFSSKHSDSVNTP